MDNVQIDFFEFLLVFLTFLHIIFKIWKYIMLLSFPSQNSRCEHLGIQTQRSGFDPRHLQNSFKNSLNFLLKVRRTLGNARPKFRGRRKSSQADGMSSQPDGMNTFRRPVGSFRLAVSSFRRPVRAQRQIFYV